MTKTKLTINEIYSIDYELNGLLNPATGVVISKGLLGHKLSLLMKYRLTEFAQKIKKIKDTVESIRMDLVKEVGVLDKEKNQYSIPLKIDNQDNPNYKKYQTEIEKLFSEEREIEHYPFKLEHLDFETEENFPIFLTKIITEE